MPDARGLDFLSSLALAGHHHHTSPSFAPVRCSHTFHRTTYTPGAGPSLLPPPPPPPPVPPPPPPPQVAHTGDKENKTIKRVARGRESWVFICSTPFVKFPAELSRRFYN